MKTDEIKHMKYNCDKFMFIFICFYGVVLLCSLGGLIVTASVVGFYINTGCYSFICNDWNTNNYTITNYQNYENYSQSCNCNYCVDDYNCNCDL